MVGVVFVIGVTIILWESIHNQSEFDHPFSDTICDISDAFLLSFIIFFHVSLLSSYVLTLPMID